MKLSRLNAELGLDLQHLVACSYNTKLLRGNIENPIGVAQIPVGLIGPLLVAGKQAVGEFYVPMATTEGALVATYDLGATLLRLTKTPVHAQVLSRTVHITPMFVVASPEDAERLKAFVQTRDQDIRRCAENGSTHTHLQEIRHRVVEDNYLLQFRYDTEDAHGLNMINKATFTACEFISRETEISYHLRSHYSGIKHQSPLNVNEGYGRHVRAEAVVPERALARLGITAEEGQDYSDRCIACARAAGIEHTNVHASNGIAAIFLACGQDMADISSCHVCQTHSEVINGRDLQIEVEIPNLLVGTVGGGTGLGTQRECLSIMGCYGTGKADKFAEIIAATVLAGEFPTGAAVVNKTYVAAHEKYGRNKDKTVP